MNAVAIALGFTNGTRMFVLAVRALTFLSLLSGSAVAQEQTARSSPRGSSLPDAPMSRPDALIQNNQTADGLDAQQAASISGTVLDPTGAAIRDAQVSLVLPDGNRLRAVKSDADGRFTFANVAPGSYLLTVEAAGFRPFTTNELVVTAKQVYSVPEISLSVAGSTTSVVVRPTEVIAAEQIKAQEQQRVFGLFPNFYVSYVPDAAPLTSKQKLSLAAHKTFDWTSFAGVSLGAGLQQATNTFPGYGQGAAGYGKRWAALYADGRSTDLLSRYVFASLFHQDPRYFYQGTGTTKSRLRHALSNAFVARSDSGKTMPNYSYLLGATFTGAISNAYYPRANRGANLVFINAALGIAGRATQGFFEEFIAKRFTKNVPEPTPAETTQAPPNLQPKPSDTGPTSPP